MQGDCGLFRHRPCDSPSVVDFFRSLRGRVVGLCGLHGSGAERAVMAVMNRNKQTE